MDLLSMNGWTWNTNCWGFSACLWLFANFILLPTLCVPFAASGSTSAAFTLFRQTDGWCHSKLGCKEQRQVYSESDCFQAWNPCEIARMLHIATCLGIAFYLQILCSKKPKYLTLIWPVSLDHVCCWRGASFDAVSIFVAKSLRRRR